MTRKTVLILGDSTSMTIGANSLTYPSLLARRQIWSADVDIVNCSLPGFTSADACAFFFNNLANYADLKSVVIYLGNCDTMATELGKSRFTPYKQFALKLRQDPSKIIKARLKNHLLHYQWNNDFDLEREKPIADKDFEYNILRVIKYCDKKNIPILLINPIAHKQFPAGSGKGNFAFYHYYDLSDKISDKITIDDKRFIEAASLFENSQFAAAAKKYKDILCNPGQLSSNLEFQLLTVNNYAVCQARAGNIEEAKYLLHLISQEQAVRKEIILYNLAMIKKWNGEKDYSEVFDQSYESDMSMYRVRQPYRDIIERVIKSYPFLHSLDMKQYFSDSNFIDHCHLLPDFQVQIADLVAPFFEQKGLSGNTTATIVNALTNPEYSSGNWLGFDEYFKIESGLQDKEIAVAMVNVESQLSEGKAEEEIYQSLPVDMQYAFDYYKKHPCFSRYIDVVRQSPLRKMDVGRFPEYFFSRFMVAVMREIENDTALSKVISGKFSLLRPSQQHINILPAFASGGPFEWKQLDHECLKDWRTEIISTVKKQIASHLGKKNQIESRLKGTIFWYFRETLRFGSNSRVSMRYERLVLEYGAEALATTLVIDKRLGLGGHDESTQLLRLLESIVSVHERFSANYCPGEDNRTLLKEYDQALATYQDKLAEL